MPADPCLVIQMQRMGDMVLSFPLFAWLLRRNPGNPLWVAAEPAFYEALLPLAPPVVFFPPQADLRGTIFSSVINLSHRPEAARLSGSLRAGAFFGPRLENGIPRIRGNWHLYRASLVHNNRHNLLHWSDLAGLDVIAPSAPALSVWPEPRAPRGNGRVGLFLGASEPAKRPEPSFWAELAAHLLRRGFEPVFLGGPDDLPLGDQAAHLAGTPGRNLCGRFALDELVRFLAELDLLVTPDTGPMHVGAWGGTLTLNLSMGPVNAWETAPFPPGHLVLRPTASCTGCWQCPHSPPPCRERFVPGRIASLVQGLFRAGGARLPVLPGLRLLRTSRSPQGLFELEPASPSPETTSRYALGDFWRQWFLQRLGGPPSRLDQALDRLRTSHPDGLALLRTRLPAWQGRFSASLRRRILPGDFWLRTPPLFRPLAGYLQLFLENEDFSRESWLAAVAHLESLAASLRDA